MATLTGSTIASTYKQLLKVTSEGIGADASAKYIEDGLGTDSALSISTTRIGIGTAAPADLLHVSASAVSGRSDNGSTRAIIEANGHAYLQISTNASSVGGVLFGDDGDSSRGNIAYNHGTDKLSLRAGGSDVFVIDANSRISLSNNDNGANNTVFGKLAGANLASGGNENTLIGEGAGNALTTGQTNVAIGREALYFGTTETDHNVAIGGNCMAGNFGVAAVNDCVAVGESALNAVLTAAASGSVAVGKDALGALLSGANNTAVGYTAMLEETLGDNNTVLGYGAMNDSLGGLENDNNTLIGYNSGGGTWLTAASTGNTAVGAGTLAGAMNAASDNVAIGINAAGSITTGDKNTCIGRSSGNHDIALATGYGNTLIGADTDTSAVGSTNQIVIGRDCSGVADNSVTLGNADVTAVYMAQDATSNYTTNTHGATVYAGGLHLKKSQVTHDSGGITSPLVVHNSFDDSPEGTGVGIDLVMSAEDTDNGAVTGRIGSLNVSGAMGSGGSGFSSTMQFWNISNGTLTKQLALNGDDGHYNTTIFAATLSSAVRYGLYLENDGNDANCYGMQIKAGKDDASGTTTYISCADGNGDQIGHISNTSGTFALTDPSDSRLKKNIVDTTLKGVETVDKMKVRDFEWIKSGDKKKAGFIAQELIDAFPSAVTGEDGAMEDILDEDGNKTGERIKPMGVSRDVLVPVLIKAVQELSARVKELENE